MPQRIPQQERGGEPPVSPGVAALVRRLCRHIDAQVAAGAPRDAFTLDALGAVARLSPYHLQRQFTRVMGMSPAQYVRVKRSERLRDELRTEGSVSRAVFGAGYGSSSRVYDATSGARLGMTPATYASGGAGMEIRYTIVASRYGRLLVAVTSRGVCAVTLGTSDRDLTASLKKEYPRAAIERVDDGDEWLADLVARVSAALPGGAAIAETIPLDVQGTAFQWQVWRALQEIPRGETRTYTEVARSIGRPTSVRAVARACASNRAAIVIPCHRVIREDGSLGGYRWGIERKERLLGEERAAG